MGKGTIAGGKTDAKGFTQSKFPLFLTYDEKNIYISGACDIIRFWFRIQNNPD
jgi:hypothetical protein